MVYLQSHNRTYLCHLQKSTERSSESKINPVIPPSELRDIPFFAALDEPTLADIARKIQRCEYRPGEHIMFEGEQPPGLFFVRRGRVRLSRTAPDGREQVLAMVGAGENFNAVPLFDDAPNPTAARAMSPVHCLLLPRNDLLALIRKHPDLALAALRELAGQLRDLVVLVEDLAFRSVRERLARQLLREADEGTAVLTNAPCLGAAMAYIIVEPCIGVKDASCVAVCPVDCIYEGEDQYYINPDECIDCGACEPECPVEAIFTDDSVPEEWQSYIAKNRNFF